MLSEELHTRLLAAIDAVHDLELPDLDLQLQVNVVPRPTPHRLLQPGRAVMVMNVTLCRSCQASIVWAIVADSGERMPIDALPVMGGNVRLLDRGDAIDPTASVVGSTIDLFDTTDDGIRYQSHFASCPDAAEWRANQQPTGGAA